MSKKLLELVEALREAGQQAKPCPEHFMKAESRDKAMLDLLCIDEHNAQVDAAAKALVAEVESDQAACPGCGKPYGNSAHACNNPACNRDCLHGF
jgi:PleD family two-component response regulator